MHLAAKRLVFHGALLEEIEDSCVLPKTLEVEGMTAPSPTSMNFEQQKQRHRASRYKRLKN